MEFLKLCVVVGLALTAAPGRPVAAAPSPTNAYAYKQHKRSPADFNQDLTSTLTTDFGGFRPSSTFPDFGYSSGFPSNTAGFGFDDAATDGFGTSAGLLHLSHPYAATAFGTGFDSIGYPFSDSTLNQLQFKATLASGSSPSLPVSIKYSPLVANAGIHQTQITGLPVNEPAKLTVQSTGSLQQSRPNEQRIPVESFKATPAPLQQSYSAPVSVPQQQPYAIYAPLQQSYLASASAPQQQSYPATESVPQQQSYPAAISVPIQQSYPATASAPLQQSYPTSVSIPQQQSSATAISAPLQQSYPSSVSAPLQQSYPASAYVRQQQQQSSATAISAPLQQSYSASVSAPLQQSYPASAYVSQQQQKQQSYPAAISVPLQQSYPDTTSASFQQLYVTDESVSQRQSYPATKSVSQQQSYPLFGSVQQQQSYQTTGSAPLQQSYPKAESVQQQQSYVTVASTQPQQPYPTTVGDFRISAYQSPAVSGSVGPLIASEAGSVPDLILELRPPPYTAPASSVDYQKNIPSTPSSAYQPVDNNNNNNNYPGNDSGLTTAPVAGNSSPNQVSNAPNGGSLPGNTNDFGSSNAKPDQTFSNTYYTVPFPVSNSVPNDISNYFSFPSISYSLTGTANSKFVGSTNAPPTTASVPSFGTNRGVSAVANPTGGPSSSYRDVNSIPSVSYTSSNAISANSYSDSNSIQSSSYTIPSSPVAGNSYSDYKLSTNNFYGDSNSISSNNKRESPTVNSSEKFPKLG